MENTRIPARHISIYIFLSSGMSNWLLIQIILTYKVVNELGIVTNIILLSCCPMR